MLYLWEFHVYDACLFLFPFSDESVHLHYVFICLIFLYKVLQESLCVYVFNFITTQKFYVVYPSWMLWMLQYGIRAPVFNIEPGWVEQVELKKKFIEN